MDDKRGRIDCPHGNVGPCILCSNEASTYSRQSKERSATRLRCLRDVALLRALALMIEAEGEPLPYDSKGNTFVMQEIEGRIARSKWPRL